VFFILSLSSDDKKTNKHNDEVQICIASLLNTVSEVATEPH